MRKEFYFLPLLLFLFNHCFGQPCSSLTVNCIPSESRCVSTGSILINVSGGSGTYTFKAVGPVTTPTTSVNTITGLAPGYYSVQVKDMNTGCIKQVDSVHVTGNYEDPRFQLTKTDASCANNDGTISVVNQQFGRGPFSYKIIAPSPSNIGSTSSSGHFTGLTWGEYTIQLTDSCGGIQVRKVTIESYFFWFDHVNVTRVGCDSADISIVVRDNKNHISNIDTSFFNGYSWGYVLNGDTTWRNISHFRMYIGKKRSLKILVKDPCGTTFWFIWNLPEDLKPNLDSVSMTNPGCTTFTASVTGQNLTNPQYCVFNSSNVSIACNTTGVFNNLAYGSYCIKVTDVCYDTVITRCFSFTKPQPSVGPTVSVTNKNCTRFTASIMNMQNLTNPNVCLYNGSNLLQSCNTTGVFTNLLYGSYCIKVSNSCLDTTITRCFTVTKPVPTLTNYTITGNTCSGFDVSIGGSGLNNPKYCLYDSLGQVVTCDSTGVFTGIPHGSYCVRAISCGDTTSSLCFTTKPPVPSVDAIVATDKKCNYFKAYITGQLNLTFPGFCLYNSNDSLLRCNSIGVFDSIPYGSYCIKVHNTCYDTIIVRCFDVTRPMPDLNDTIQVLSTTCDSVTFMVSGTNLVQPQFCLYAGSKMAVSCNSTGMFTSPYGSYCIRMHDGCVDTTLVICKNFAPVRGITLTSSKPCLINKTYINVSFASGKSPFKIKVYNPAGALIYDSTATANPEQLLLPALATGLQYKIVGTDSCGNRDSAFIVPNASIVNYNTSVRGKCPSAMWQYGSGDILAACSSNYFAVIPQIVKKNGAAFNMGYSSVLNGVYTFADLEPAQYIIEYALQLCDAVVYDTVNVSTYTFPTQGQTVLYQCDNNGFSLNAEVNGGLSPYSFQIIGSVPASPSIATTPQTSPDFFINTGAVYSLVRLRAVDGCGNATLNDVSVMPLQNVSIHASDTCFFQNIVLTVDTLPQASYFWYKKTSPTDSVLLGTSPVYNLPYFLPEQIGQYVCKVVVNGGCLTRIARYDLFGCNPGVLSAALQLQGRKNGKTHQLYWNNLQDVKMNYIVERKTIADEDFRELGKVESKQGTNFYIDYNPANGLNQYRLKLEPGDKIVYTNIVSLVGGNKNITVYPNPAKTSFSISISASIAADYDIELLNSAGQVIYSKQLKNIKEAVVNYQRDYHADRGVYLLRIKNKGTNTTDIRKLLFE